jgi:hypothetical protein
VLPAVLAGLITGAVIGAGQALLSRRRLEPRRWILASALGMAIGLPLGALTVDFRTSLIDLVVMGLVTGVALGLAQARALPLTARRRWAWAAAMPVLWGLGWAVSTGIGISVGDQFTVFGASGAVTVSALLGLLLQHLLPVRNLTPSGALA